MKISVVPLPYTMLATEHKLCNIHFGNSHAQIRREDIINKAFPLDKMTTSEQIRQRRKILGISPHLTFFVHIFCCDDVDFTM